MKTGRSGPSKCALASTTLSADCSASELGAPPVSSKNCRASQRRKPLVRTGQVSRWTLIITSAKAVPSEEWNSSAAPARSIRMSACVGPRPPSPVSSAMASSSAVTRHPAFLSRARKASKAARSSFFRSTSRSSTSGVNAAPGSSADFSTKPSSGSGISSAASMASRIGFRSPFSISSLIARPP